MKKFLGGIVLIFCISFGAMYMWLTHNKYDFSAQSTNGTMSLQDFRGQNLIVYFGYTFCPDVCPITLSLLSNALNTIDSKNIALVFITLDPQRDTPQDCQTYANYFFENAYGLWLAPQELKKVAAHYGVKFEKIPLPHSSMEYSIAHTSALYLFDTNGVLQDTITNPTLEEITQSLHNLLQKENV